jgi:hypothetical protein
VAADARVITLQNQLQLPEGVRFGELRYTSSADEDLAALRFAASLSIVFIYLLMGFLFESFILPLSVIATIPLAGIGVAWIHYALGYNLDFLGVVGIVLLIGVVVNNGIVLIDYAKRLRGEGMERGEALLVAAERRFRPIMMTALTTIIGMVPVTPERGHEHRPPLHELRPHPDRGPHDGDPPDPPRRPGLLHLLRRRPARHRPGHPPRPGDDAGRARPGLRARPVAELQLFSRAAGSRR